MRKRKLVLHWAILFGAYLLFAGQLSKSEIIAGLPASALVTGFGVLLRRAEQHRLRLDAPWFRVIGATLGALYPDALRVGRVLLAVLLRRPAGAVGSISGQPFLAGDEAPVTAGRRALVTLGSSVAANGYVVGIDRMAAALYLHRLAPVPPKPDPVWPV